MKNYCLMHLERRVATVRGDGSCTVYFPGFMPYGLYLNTAEDDIGARVGNLDNFIHW